DQFPCEVQHFERPGAFYFPILATLITGAARLMLALAEHEVTARGGSYAFMDTDSLAIVASERGGVVAGPGAAERLPDGRDAIRALSRADVDAIVERFQRLNPYDRRIVKGSILKIEDENYRPCGLAGHDRDEQGQPTVCVCTQVREQLDCYAI